MNSLIKDSNKPESGDEIGNALIRLIEENLDVNRWGFRTTFTKFIKPSNIKIIYDSEWCRIKFNFSRERLPLPKYDELVVSYGRLHAPNEDPYMEWKGQNCHCWHQIWEPLRYLDGLSPLDAIQQNKTLNQLPVVAEHFWNSNEVKPFGKYILRNMVSHYSLCYGNIMGRGCLTYLICENLNCGRDIRSFYGNIMGYLAKNLAMAPHMKTYVK